MKSPFALFLGAALAVCASGQPLPQTFSTGQAARLVIGQQSFTAGNFGATSQLLGTPSGIAFANGVLWVADSNRIGGSPDNNRVLRFNDTATYPGPTQDPTIPGSLCGVCRGNASLVLGQPDFVSANFTLTSTGMRNPTGVAVSPDGNIVAVSDTDNNRILIWLAYPSRSGQPADVVIGQPNFTSNGTAVPPTAKSLRGPEGIWIDGNGLNAHLYVADTGDNRVLIFNRIPTSNNASADVVIGAPNFTTPVQFDLTKNNTAATASNVQSPVSVTTDGTRMYVTDLAQNRVLIWNKIPTSNGAPADIALGQVNLTTSISNNSFTVNAGSALNSVGNPESVTEVMCHSNAAYAASLGQTGSVAVDSAGTTIYPPRCAATESLPRFAISNGTQLFVADGGNDRILIWNSIPTQNGQPADVILGEPDEFSDNTGQNPDGADALQTPFSLAYDGLNLFVGDSYNRRVIVYTPGQLSIPLGGNGLVNAASLTIHAVGNVTISGGITAKDTVTITINGTDYTYTIVSTDTLETVTAALVKLINAKPDPNVIAVANTVTDTVVLTARVSGGTGASITLATKVSTGATIQATPDGNTLKYFLQNPSQIAPGTLIQVTGQNLCDTTVAADLTQPFLPGNINGCQLFSDGVPVPLLYVSPTQVNAQLPFEFQDRTSTSVYMRDAHPDGSVTVTAPVAVTIVPQNPGIFAEFGSDPRPALAYHGYSSATATILVNGTVNAGDVAQITVAGTNYSYTVQATDTLQTIANGLAAAINSAPDPNVHAVIGNTFNTIILVANTPGPAGDGITVAESVTNSKGAQLSLTAYNATTCCDNTAGARVTSDNPATPGEIVYVLATGLGPPTPNNVNTGQVTPEGVTNQPVTNVDSILTDQVSNNILDSTLLPGTVGVYKVQFQLGLGLTTDLAAQTTIAQQAFVSNIVTFAIVATPTTTSTAQKPAVSMTFTK
jgi:uncharacterized protein (TIGR03437 family)